MTQYRNGVTVDGPSVAQLATKSVSSLALNATSLFGYTGTVAILSITGRVTTAIQNQATNLKLMILSDALAAYDISADLNVQAFGIGTLLSITGTAAGATVGTTVVGAIAPGQADPVTVTCTTGGYIQQNSDAASTGAITWQVLWQPLSANAALWAV